MPRDELSTRTVGGRYRLEAEIGRGGAGIVWRGEDLLLGRQVAVKEVEPHQDRDRVIREARTAARVSHPRLVTLFDVVEEDGRIFLVQELVPGRSLKDEVLTNGTLTPERAREVGLQLLAALEVLHANGIVHRDVKPSNVMVMPDGSVKLADLGIAAVAGDPDLTKTGIILGSPHYMAPEQATGERVDARADLWSLGATLFFAVEGHPPYEGPAMAAMAKIVNEPVPPMPHAAAAASAIARLLSKDRAERPTIEDTRVLLQEDATARWFDPAPTTRPAPATPAPLRPAPSGGRAWAIALGAVVALLVGGFALAATRSGNGGGEAAGETAAPRTTAAPEAQESTTSQRPTTTERATTTAAPRPGGTKTYTNEEAGYEIAHPPAWKVERRSKTIVDLVEPGTGTYLRIDWTDEPGNSPKEAWEEQEESFAKEHEGYRRIQMTEETYQGHPASLWEYTYRAEGTDLHAYNLGFVVGDERGFALNFQSRESNWAAAQDTWQELKANFRVRS